MSVVFFGQRSYGHVMAYGGERAETVFAHLQFMPLIPIRSRWVTYDDGVDKKHGFETRLNVRSVVAAYVRCWAPIGAIAAAVSLGVTGGLIAGALLALIVWSWSLLGRGNRLARRRSDMDRLAFGHRCDPALIDDAERDRLRLLLSSRLSRRDNPRPPDDVARFGARDLDEAVAAYGLLRLAARPEERAVADQLLSQAFEAMPADGGPFRTAAAPDGQATIAAKLQAEIQAQHHHQDQLLARRPRRWYHLPKVQLVGLAMMSGTVYSATREYWLYPDAYHHDTQLLFTLIADLLVIAGWALWANAIVRRRALLHRINARRSASDQPAIR